jgi:hypothetical protein
MTPSITGLGECSCELTREGSSTSIAALRTIEQTVMMDQKSAPSPPVYTSGEGFGEETGTFSSGEGFGGEVGEFTSGEGF